MSAKLQQEMKNEAFKNAVAAAKGRFAFQCQVIGFDPADFEVRSWSYQPPSTRWQPAGKRLTLGADDVRVSGHDISVECEVHLTYHRRLAAGQSL